MTVRIATADKSLSLTRSALGSTPAPLKGGSDSSFDGVLSSMADDRAAGAQPRATADKGNIGTNAKPASPPAPETALATPVFRPSPTVPTAQSMLPIAALTGDGAASWAAPVKGVKDKANHSDGSDADSGDGGQSAVQGNAPATLAGTLAQTSLLTLFQSAAASPSVGPSTGSATEGAPSGAASQADGIVASGTPNANGDPKEGSTSPLISDVTFQNYLAPSSARIGYQTVSAPKDESTTASLADTTPQIDVSLKALIAPASTRMAANKPSAGSPDPSSPSSSVIGRTGEVVPLDSVVAPSREGATASDQNGSQTPASDDGHVKDGAAQPDAMGSSGHAVDLSGTTSGKQVSARAEVPTSVAAPAAINAAVSLGGLTLPAPIQSVADAVASLAAQPASTQEDPATPLSPARTMLLQLSPGDLGTVSVRLHLTGRTLDVSLTTSLDQTADLLDHGRTALTHALGDQNYQLNSLVIQRGDSASISGSPNAASTDHQRDQGSSHAGGDPSGGNSRQGTDSSPDRQDRRPPSHSPPRARAGGLFF